MPVIVTACLRVYVDLSVDTVTLREVATLYVADIEPEYTGDELFVAFTPTA